MEYKQEDFLMLSGIQHFAFCRRQWALIHIENQWAENLRTVEGKILHERAHDKKFTEKRGDVIIARGMPVFSSTLGINGVCDVVEFRKSEKGVTLYGRKGLFLPVPVEYKRGSLKETDEDVLQLTAQAICLEEMLLCEVPEGYLFYGETNRRTRVSFDDEVRQKVVDICREMHELYSLRYTPSVKIGKYCRACSLSSICLPKLCKVSSVKEYIRRRIGDDST
jgi:CRISPR-associated exonuclease Cas4